MKNKIYDDRLLSSINLIANSIVNMRPQQEDLTLERLNAIASEHPDKPSGDFIKKYAEEILERFNYLKTINH